MAWNPSPEVAAVRDAAKKLNVPYAVVIFVTRDTRIGFASYGENKALCDHAGKLGHYLLEAAENYGQDKYKKPDNQPNLL